jgi:hypothetical protein
MDTMTLFRFQGQDVVEGHYEMKTHQKISVIIGIIAIAIILISELAIMGKFSATGSASGTQVSGAFAMKGTNVAINTLYYAKTANVPLNYQPNGFSIIQSMGVNVIFVSGGTEGDVAHFNMVTHPSEWAQNLNQFLGQAKSYGLQVIFKTMGSSAGTLFGIYAPQPSLGISGTPIATAQMLIGELAGNNSLGHNFIADPRIIAWSIGNEIDLNSPQTLNWLLKVADFVHAAGGKVFVDDPYDSVITAGWTPSMNTNTIAPLLAGHVDYLSIHIYLSSVAAQAQQSGTSVYTAVYNAFKLQLASYLISGKGAIPMQNLMLSEFGIWVGPGTYGGVTVSFTNKSVSDYYHAVYQCCQDLGIKNVFNFDFFAQKTKAGAYTNVVNFWFVDVNGNYVTSKTSVMQQYYQV